MPRKIQKHLMSYTRDVLFVNSIKRANDARSSDVIMQVGYKRSFRDVTFHTSKTPLKRLAGKKGRRTRFSLAPIARNCVQAPRAPWNLEVTQA